MKNAVVTGGGSGIGQAVAHRLRADGMNVATLDLNPSDADHSYVADVTDRAQVDAALDAVRAKLGPVTVLVNAAGLEKFKRFTDISFEDWQRVIDVNLNGVFHCIQAVLPDMIEAGWGRIVNISSSSTHSGQPYMSPYVAAKSAVNGLTKSLALEYGPSGITVNAVPPGFIDTPMLRKSEGRGYLERRAEHRHHTGAPHRQARGHRRRVRIPDLRGSRLHHRTDPGRQRRPKHLTTISRSERTYSVGRVTGKGRIRHRRRARAGPQSRGPARRGRRRHHRGRPLPGHRRPSATRWRRRRTSRRPPSSSRRPAGASSPPRPTCARPRSCAQRSRTASPSSAMSTSSSPRPASRA